MNTFTNNARLTLVLAVIVLLALTGMPTLNAQETTAGLQGNVKDASGA